MSQHPLYVPDFHVEIEGKSIPGSLRAAVTSLTLITGLEGADRVEMVVSNNASVWIDDEVLNIRKKPPLKFTLYLGYRPDTLEPMFYGELTGISASFPSNGVMQLTVTAQDKRHRLKQATTNEMHSTADKQGNKPIPDELLGQNLVAPYELTLKRDTVNQQIGPLVDAAARLSLGNDPDSRQKASRRQANETDYDLLRRMARESGCEMIIDHSRDGKGKVLNFLFPPGHTNADVKLEYGLSLMEFTPRESIVGQVHSVSTNVKVSATQKTHGITLAVNDELTELTLTTGDEVIKPPKGRAEDSVVLNEPLTPDTAPRRLLAELLTRTNQRLTGSGSCIGNPLIRAGGILELSGLGERFGGIYRVTSATHSIDTGGYRTRFDLRKEIGLYGLKTIVPGAKKVVKKPKTSS